MTRLDLLCIGEPMLEFNQLPLQPDGRRLYLETHGGDTSNAAIAAARQGARVGYVTAIGADPAGDSLMELWRTEGVDTSGVLRDPENPTAIYFVVHDEVGHDFLYYRRGSAASLYRPTQLPEATIASARMIYASGISQGISDSAADTVFRAIEVARANSVRVAYDTNFRPRLWPPRRAAAVIHAAIAQADIALPGLDDVAALTGLTDPDAIVDFYLALGPQIVALKMGAAGTLLAIPERRLRIPPFACRPVDATGAGDTFCGSFLARLIAGDAPEDAARYAACAAALSTRGFGAVAPIPHAATVRAELSAVPGSET
ncbi:MAG: sugar kinase [Pseudomonadota bacterium]|nr:sugar kinase [Pseudomonadota bacterium]